MNLRLLKYFAVLADELNYRRAAERLHIEISPLSRAIQSLETTLGCLFVRSNRGTLLTPEGKRYGSTFRPYSAQSVRRATAS